MSNIACERDKLNVLEEKHLSTLKELELLASSSTASAAGTNQLTESTEREETELLRQRVMDEQDAVDNQKFLVDNLEFQQLEVLSQILSCQKMTFIDGTICREFESEALLCKLLNVCIMTYTICDLVNS